MGKVSPKFGPLGVSHVLTSHRTPKELARIYRFKHILQHIDPTQPIDWSDVAYRSGYYDQSHFNKDFEAFTGHNPSGYLRLRYQLYLQNPQLAQYPQHLPTG